MGRVRALTEQFSNARAVYEGTFSEEQLQGLRNIFQQLDADNSGTLELADIESYMMSVGWPLPDQMQEEFESFDKDLSGGLDVEEFLDLMVWAAGSQQGTADRGRSEGHQPALEASAADEEDAEDEQPCELRQRISSMAHKAESSSMQAKWLHQELDRASEQLDEAALQQDALRGQLAARSAELEVARRDLKEAQHLLDDRRASEARGVSAALDALRAAIAKCEEEKRSLAAAVDAGAVEIERLARHCCALDRALAISAARAELLVLFGCWRQVVSSSLRRSRASEAGGDGAGPELAAPEVVEARDQEVAGTAAEVPGAKDVELHALRVAVRSLLPELSRLGRLAELAAGSAPRRAPAAEGEAGALHDLGGLQHSDGALCDEAALLRRECLRWQHLLSEHLRQRQSPAPGCCSCFDWLWKPSS